jgi:hypothetical protein
MILSIFGFLISIFYVDNILGNTWAIAFAMVFLIMIVSGLVSMVYAPIQDYDKPEHRKKPVEKN